MKQILIIMWLVTLVGCAQTPKEEWLTTMVNRCYAMGGNQYFDAKNQTFECFRHPIGRMTKSLFKETFSAN